MDLCSKNKPLLFHFCSKSFCASCVFPGSHQKRSDKTLVTAALKLFIVQSANSSETNL